MTARKKSTLEKGRDIEHRVSELRRYNAAYRAEKAGIEVLTEPEYLAYLSS